MSDKDPKALVCFQGLAAYFSQAKFSSEKKILEYFFLFTEWTSCFLIWLHFGKGMKYTSKHTYKHIETKNFQNQTKSRNEIRVYFSVRIM